MSGVARRFRDVLRDAVPWWLSDRHYSSGKSVGFRYLWSIIAPLDAFMDVLFQGLLARYPGLGTPTALPYIGRDRNLIRGPSDTDLSYGARLAQWLDKAAFAGSQRQLAIELHEYLTGNPRVRVINRAGHWVTVAADGTVTTTNHAWDWDSISNPERVGFWSEQWIVIYPSPYAIRAGTLGGLTGDDGYGIGHMVPHSQVAEVKSVLASWKAAHTKIRTVIWTSDGTLFDPASPGSLPDGQWGQWGMTGGGSRVASHRNYTTCRYWEPNS